MTEGDIDLLALKVNDPYVIAELLKTFLRELPSPLLSNDMLVQSFITMGMLL